MRNTLFTTLVLLLITMLAVFSSCSAGGWHRLSDAQFKNLEDEEQFEDIIEAAQDYVQSKVKNANFQLGDLRYVETQVVAGTNYRLIYENDDGEQASVVVFSQPWTDTIEVLSFEQNYDSDAKEQQVQEVEIQ